uniref:Glycine receptor beta n=1 Tax=Eptatretus burgeri TaxID=7764 RepID=A0A8C4QDQ2_EPTBU
MSTAVGVGLLWEYHCSMSLTPCFIVGIDYRVNIFIRQQWNDPRLQIPDHIRGVETLTLDPALIRCMWRPDLFFANEKMANFHSVTKQNTLLFVSGNGDILMSMRLSLTLSCPMDLTLFPMDTQRCKMQLESFGYTTDDLIFNWAAGEPVQMEKMTLPQFDISQKDIVYGNCTKYYKGTGYYTCVEVIFTLRRQVGFYIMGIYAPTLLLVVLSWLTFWINPEASPARVSLGILSILSLFSQSMSLATDLPKVSYVKALDIWLLTCLIYGFASLVQYAIVQICLNNPRYIAAEKQRKELKEKQRKRIMPPGANDDRVWTISTRNGTPTAPRGARRVCMSRSDLRTGDFSIVGSLPRDFDLTNYDCYGKPIGGVGPGGAGLQGKGPAKPPSKQIVPFEAKRVDHYSRALFPITFFFFNIIYWSIYL